MSAFLWWRSWHGAPTDHKWAVIAARSGVKVGIVSAVAWALMDYASQHKERGTVDGFDIEEYAVYSGFAETEIAAVINAMNDKGIIKAGRLTHWEKRQPIREDNSYNRVTKFRDMKCSVTQCNAEISQDKDTDKDTDKEREEKAPPRPLVFTLYEQNIGILTPMITDELLETEKEYPADWIEKAIAETVSNNVHNWKYVKAILARWKKDGIGSNGKKKTGGIDEAETLRLKLRAEAKEYGFQ